MQGLTRKLYVDGEVVSELLVGEPVLGVEGDVLSEEAHAIQSPIAIRALAQGRDVRLEVWDPEEPEEAGPLAVLVFDPNLARFN